MRPRHIDLKRDERLLIEWEDGSRSTWPIAWLRRMSPSADMRELREEMARNPLAVLPASLAAGPVTAIDAELVGTYALRIRFSDGHDTGIYTWAYLRSIEPPAAPEAAPVPRGAPPG